MREYNPKFPLKRINHIKYPNLLCDEDGNTITDNITWFTLTNKESVLKAIGSIENHVKEDKVEDVEVFYRIASGNFWIGLLAKSNLNDKELLNMQDEYSYLYGKGHDFWHEKYEAIRNEKIMHS